MKPTWLTAFLDLPAAHHDEAVEFWRGVTGYGLSSPRGDDGEFATLVPPDGDAYLRVQRTSSGATGIHLDLHHPEHDFQVLASPAGFAYCEVSAPLSRRPSVQTWPGGHSSVVDQVCLDIPGAAYDEECDFWSARLGRELRSSQVDPNFRSLPRSADEPLRVMLQRVADDRPRAGAHFDLATDDREAETRRHLELGASVTSRHEYWTALTDPTGSAYCITDRRPDTGMLG